MADIVNKRLFPHHKNHKYIINNKNIPAFNEGNMITSTVQQTTPNVIKKKTHYQQKLTKKNNSLCTDDVPPYGCQAQYNNNQKPNGLFPSRNSQVTSKHVINSCSLPSQKKKKKDNSTNLQYYNKRSNHPQDVVTPQTFYAQKSEVLAGLPHSLFVSRNDDYDFRLTSPSNRQYSLEQSEKFHRVTFESSSCSLCKSFSTINSEDSDGAKNLQNFSIKLPGMSKPTLVPGCTTDNNDQKVRVFSSPKINIDLQLVRVKLPGMQNYNSAFLCEEPWWLSPKETATFPQVTQEQEGRRVMIEEKVVLMGEEKKTIVIEDEIVGERFVVVELGDVKEEYESAHNIEIQSETPNVKLPSWLYMNNAFKFIEKKELEYVDDYCCMTTSECIEFDKVVPVVRLCPKPISQISSPRSNLPNLKIETNLNLDKDDEDGFFRSAGNSTLSTPISDTFSFSNISTYAESDNTVFTEEEIINETKLCTTPERRPPSVLSDLSSEHLTPVLEEEEENESKVTSPTGECQELTIEVSREHEIFNEVEDENEYPKYQETRGQEDFHDNNKQIEFTLPELRKIVEQLEKSQSDSKETIRIRRQLETISKDNYPDSLPLSNKWTMYIADTSVTKTNARIISKNKYSSTLNPIFSCATVPELCTSLREFSSKIKPSDMKSNMNLSFFKGDIMPMWEDEANHKGGRFTLCPSRNHLNSLWDSIVLLLAGEMIDDNDLICGAVCARRDRGDRVELWISGDAYPKAIDQIRDLLSEELGDDIVKNVKYKKHIGKP